MKKSIEDFDLKNKKVIIRVDFNVPIIDNKILNDSRIVSSLKTIKYAMSKNAKVILLSHLGRIKSISDKEKNSLVFISNRLSELLNKKVSFSPVTRGKILENMIDNLKPGDVLLVENTRYEDIDGKKESSNDKQLGRYWASLGDIFINDAFGTSHRSHASNVGISKILPSGVGFLVKEELEKFKILDDPLRPYTVILGGAKVKDKIGVIEKLVKIADFILIGGGMAFTFLKSQGVNTGLSLCDQESLEFCKNIMNTYKDKIILPIDTIVAKKIGDIPTLKELSDINADDIGLDIGDKTITLFSNYIKKSQTIMWNGPLGYYENELYSTGTKKILEVLANSTKTVIIGGGDISSAAINFGYKNSFTHISTGGGASLELLEGKKLPAIEVIDEK